jgi:anti-sigma regulatory factor (Ser/Thr protein kinase)
MCTSTPSAQLLLPMESTSPLAARAFARRSGCPHHALDLLDDALLLISELVTNSIRHGGPPIVLAIDCDGEGLHVRVRDGATDLPRLAERGEYAESGRGIALVDVLSSTWGAEPVEDDYGPGKQTWFRLERQSPEVT